ncbi:GNAT family N-acetyltransferase [Paenibacillus methanolicus]|uniref:Uncharacterized protein n=1 Tax=Paenibacillus methanolicus TaxID=582686 RepID=A0A5S5BP56_9BACL|nr:GNAT family N-acetyltransferase [Paenibacillus methanolicus]TYP68086.1 hypothetical protein BCM02_12046 [Paenibacillus methanolicus]
MRENNDRLDKPQEEIIAEKQGNSYILTGVGGTIGEIHFRMIDVDTWVIDRTYVQAEYRGQGLAKQLLDLVADEARERGRRIIPSCSYALEQFKQDPAYADVWDNKNAADYADPYSSDSVGATRP